VQPCEAAHLASLDSIRGGSATPPQVTVLVVYVVSFMNSFRYLMIDQAKQCFQDAKSLLRASQCDGCSPPLCA
jgi:hypothetical protein